NFPPGVYGTAFACEPAGNLIKCDRLSEKEGVVTAQPAYTNSEFLASTDERFRPVNAYTGPDGALYVVDMYHGVIQHHLWVTTYLQKQMLERDLERPVHQGRIYRIVHQAKALGPRPRLSQASTAELVKDLAHPNGWWRDTAQRLLVERQDSTAV